MKQGSAKYDSTNLHTGCWSPKWPRNLSMCFSILCSTPMEVKSSILAMNYLIDCLILLLWLHPPCNRGLPICCASLPTARTHQVSPECAWMQITAMKQTTWSPHKMTDCSEKELIQPGIYVDNTINSISLIFFHILFIKWRKAHLLVLDGKNPREEILKLHSVPPQASSTAPAAFPLQIWARSHPINSRPPGTPGRTSRGSLGFYSSLPQVQSWASKLTFLH